jgi:dTDP-D-glucose 4,6-dehydratase
LLTQVRENGKFVIKGKYMAKALEQELLQYILQLDDAEKKSVLQMLKTFVKGREGKASRVSIEEYNLELQKAEEEFEKGEYATHEEFVKQIKKW